MEKWHPNRHVEVNFYDFENKKCEREFRKILMPCLQFLPKWLRVVNVFECQSDDFVLSVFLDDVYRRAKVSVTSSWFTSNEEAQKEYIVHEVCHLFIAELTAHVKDRILPIIESNNEELGKALHLEFQDRIERVTQDLMYYVIGVNKDNENKNPHIHS